jgi:hypothetical protein
MIHQKRKNNGKVTDEEKKNINSAAVESIKAVTICNHLLDHPAVPSFQYLIPDLTLLPSSLGVLLVLGSRCSKLVQ